MYNRLDATRNLTVDFVIGVEEFIEFAKLQFAPEDVVRCPCVRCMSRKLLPPGQAKVHLYRYGFKGNYWRWTENGETEARSDVASCSKNVGIGESSGGVAGGGGGDEDVDATTSDPLGGRYQEMAYDIVGPDVAHQHQQRGNDQPPDADTQKFFDMLDRVSNPIWQGSRHSQLSVALRLIDIKGRRNVSHGTMDECIGLMNELAVDNTHLPADWYETTSMVDMLGMPSEWIDVCVAGCMLFWKDDLNLTACKFCDEARYKAVRLGQKKGTLIPRKRMHYLRLIPRLQRLFTSMSTAPHMRWHHENRRVPGIVSHPSDAAAWKHFDNVYPGYAAEPRNVRLGLCADGFNPFGASGGNYSCWPVIVTPYNMPPEMCMTAPYMFLTCIIPGKYNPKAKIDVYLQPLIEELQILWSEGVLTYDVSTKQNFTLRAHLMWTINDFPAYGMLSGWQTAGRLACPYCMGDTKAFQLHHGRKNSWFDCHRRFLRTDHPYRRKRNAFKTGVVERGGPPERLNGLQLHDIVNDFYKITDTGSQLRIDGYGVDHNWIKRSIFWELPYWRDNLLQHNLDVMHIEKNVFDNIFNTVMDVKGKTKDNEKARLDLPLYCSRPALHLESLGNNKFKKPKAAYTLSLDQRRVLCQWLKDLKFSDGHASHLGGKVDMGAGKVTNLKSHDCHVILERLLPVALRSFLPKEIWEAITDLSCFFRDLCSTTLREQDMFTMSANIPAILCKLEMIFPPSFFDSMEHLPVHLPYEVWAGGPVQFRWMYPFER